MLRPALFCALLASPAAADITVQFSEGAPKDRFTILNSSACPTGAVEITIDLSGSAAGLIFDTTGRGAGVSVFQPFELVSGAAQVTAVSEVSDGDVRAVLSLSDLPAQRDIAFTIDVDDTLPASANGQTMVSGGEISGALVRASSLGGTPVTAQFDQSGTARVPWQACLS